jgi:hypothetical protein
MFDRIFFEHNFHDLVGKFARSQKIPAPVVEFLLDDGAVVYLRSIEETREGWLAVLVYDDEPGPHAQGVGARLILSPYFSIKRITLHKSPPKPAKHGELGFQLPTRS